MLRESPPRHGSQVHTPEDAPDCVVEHMGYRADEAGRTAVLGNIMTVPGPQLALSAPVMRQGSSVARLRSVDRQAAEDLFAAGYPRLAGWVRRLVDDDDTAHEIASEAFTRLLARWTGLDNPQSYLYMIATNLVRDHWRKSGRERRAIRSLTAAAPDDAYHPAQDVDVRALIEALAPRLRAAFLLHYYAGFGVREVAAMLGRPEGTVKADLYHARAQLKAALDEGPREQPGGRPASQPPHQRAGHPGHRIPDRLGNRQGDRDA
jgi:RNA polymerase sigma-70 factor, ECF subfamily